MALFKKNMDMHTRLLYHALVYPLFFLFCFWFVFFVEWFLKADFKEFGVYPLALKGLKGIITMPFIHADFKHLFANSAAFFLLTTLLFSNYRHIALRVFILIWLVSGSILWIIGRQNWHIGASGVVYGIAFFLFLRGFFSKKIQLAATSLIVAFLYGSMVWYMFPLGVDRHISWEGHLSGAVIGSLLAIYYKLKEPPEIPITDNEEEEVEYDWQVDEVKNTPNDAV
ncbi:MAG: rhomboid family intramembrane serine protease [Paludibacteraceae bacterium]|nr:rhomboid family intramembrane serine protease [Paludibacteraceae bacterium]